MNGWTRSVKAYDRQLAPVVCEPTLHSHLTTINKFVGWCESNGIGLDAVEPATVDHFLTDIEELHADLTLRPMRSTLVNYLAFVWDIGPAFVAQAVIDQDTHAHNVVSLLKHLRTHRFGTRTHVLLEVLAASAEPPSQTRQLNCQHYQPDSETLEVPTSDRYVIARVGGVESTTLPLPERFTEALDVYCAHNRNADIGSSGDAPLLTTRYGRISHTMISRSVKEVATTVLGDEAHEQANSNEPIEDSNSVSPRTIANAPGVPLETIRS